MVFLRFYARSQVIGATVHYPSFLTLTNSNALESVLADVPFFAVGLLGFGVFTFFSVMGRVNRLTIYAHLAVLLAFVSAILDLSQVLERGAHNTDIGADLDEVAPLIILRELGYAVSVGVRLFFFWSFVAEPPRGELPPLPLPDERRPNFITPDSDKLLHSGSWKRWGIIGIIMKWSLLLVVIAVPILQAIWRLAVGFMNFGPVYNTEATLEIVVAALFILKLLANVWLSPLTPRWRTFRDYSPIIFALLINVGLGVGNVLCFEFSESAFGRFISAVDFYIIILYILISSFYKMPVPPSVIAELVRRRLESSPFEGLPTHEAGSSFRVTPPSVSSPDLAQAQTILQSNRRPSLLTRLSNFSTTSRVSTWLINRGASNRQDDQRDRLWALGQAERGEPTLERKSTVDSTEPASMGQRQSVGWTDPTLNTVGLKEKNSEEVLRAPYALSPTPSTGRRSSRTMDPVIARFDASEQLPSFFVTPAKRSSEFGGDYGSRNSTGTGDSPIYGLNGIIPKPPQVDPLDTTRYNDETKLRVSAADSLLRQQEELDRSIADLRLFSPNYSMDQSRRPSDTMKSESLRSDFSLSNFPDPPMFIRSENNSALPSPTVPTEAQRKDSDATDTFLDLLAPRTLNMESGSTRAPSLPVTTRGSDPSFLGTRAVRLDSQGTQYDVTSFIGDLSTPGVVRGRENSLSQVNEVVGGEETPNPELGPRRGVQGLPRFVKPSPLSISQPQLPLAAIQDPDSPIDTSKPATSSNTSESVQQSTIPSSYVPRFATGSQRADRQKRGLQLPAQPRLKISNPIRNSNDVLGVPQAFERPRPPPLVLKGSAKDDTTAAKRF